ncbi:hypothetical protein NSQ26_11740 [Bacillus sp. FSL W7-1360]
MKKSFKICKIVLKMWLKEFAKIINSYQKLILLIFFLGSIMFVGAYGSYQLTSPIMETFLQGNYESLTLLVFAALMNTSVISVALYIAFKTITPEQDRLSTQLNWFPLSKFDIQVGYYLPFVAMITFTTLLFTSIMMLPSLLVHGIDIGFIGWLYAVILLQTLMIVSLAHATYTILYVSMKKVGLPLPKSLSLFALTAICVILGLSLFDLNEITTAATNFDYKLFYLLAPLFLVVFDLMVTSPSMVFAVTSVLLFAVAIPFITMLLPYNQPEKRQVTLLSSVEGPKNKYLALMMKELKTAIRHEETISTFVMIVTLLLIAVISFEFTPTVYAILPYFLAALASLHALQSYGNDVHMFPLYRFYGLETRMVFGAKLSALVAVALFQLIVFFLFIVSPYLTVNMLLICVAVLLTASLILYAIGSIIPINKDNPLTGVFSFASLLVFVIPMFFIINTFFPDLSLGIKIGIIIVFESILLYLAFYVTKWRLHYV